MDTLSTWYHNSKTVSDIFTGLYSSGIFLLVLSLLKPRIKISDKISLVVSKGPIPDRQEKYRYYIKLVNKSIFFRIYDIQVRAWSTETKPSQNAEDTYFKEIELVKNYQWAINRLYFGHICQNSFMGEKRLEARTDYAAQFLTLNNLQQMIDDGRSINVEVIAKHSLTGFTRVIHKTYKHSGDIISGCFFSGNSCKIK